MKLQVPHRRQLLHLAAGATALSSIPRSARGQAYPTRPVRIIVGFPAGGSPDIVARLIGQWLSERLGQRFVIDDRPGAASNIATEAVVRAPPDGYTLLLVTSANPIVTALYQRLRFDFIRDIAPVASIVRAPLVMVVHPSVPPRTVPEFIAYAKANPGKINYASPGIGSTNHVAGELFTMMAGVEMVHVPYRTSPVPDLLAGQVQVMFVNLPPSIDYIRADKLRALAVSTATRSTALPDTPAISEFLRGYEASSWYGIGAPRDTPVGIIQRLNTVINAALVSPVMQMRLADLGGIVYPISPADFGTLIADETEKWGRVIRAAGIKAE